MEPNEVTAEEVQSKKQKILNAKPIKWIMEHPEICELVGALLSVTGVVLNIYHDKSEMKDALYLTSTDKNGNTQVVKTKCKVVRTSIPGRDKIGNSQKDLLE